MRYPGAIWRPGPADKQGYPGLTWNAKRGVVLHSMVGSLQAAFGELDKPERRASWHFSIAQTGAIYQHYETEAVCWHAGNTRYNGIYLGIEHEGGPPHNESEPLTFKQLESSVLLVRWLAQRCPFPLVRKIGLWEHNELYATACPSGRIPWPQYEEEPRVYSDEEIDKKFLTAIEGVTDYINDIRDDLKAAIAQLAQAQADDILKLQEAVAELKGDT